MSDRNDVLAARGIARIYAQGETDISVLTDVNIEMTAGEKVAVVGRSGSGKSTLLHILAGLDDPSAGTVTICGQTMTGATPDDRARLRASSMGFVYQNHHLLPEFTALENVAMPLRITGLSANDAAEKARDLLSEVGLDERSTHLPHELSGGERQRVAVARAIAGEPAVVLADEPTGNLDKKNADQVMQTMFDLCERHGTAFLVVTHDRSMLDSFDRVYNLENGSLTEHSNAG